MVMKVITHILKTVFWSLLLDISKNILIDATKKINLAKPNTLDKLFSKFELKIRLIRKDIHNRTKRIKYLFLNIKKFFFFTEKTTKITHIINVFKLISILPTKKHMGYIAINTPDKTNNRSSLNLIFNFCNIMLNNFFNNLIT